MPRIASIESILKKKSWTGKDVGRLLIAGWIFDRLHPEESVTTPLVPHAAFSRIQSTLTSEEDLSDLEVYKSLYRSISEKFEYSNALHNQFDNGFYRLYTQLKVAETYELGLKDKGFTPLIMTEEQYERLSNVASDELKKTPENFYGVMFYMLKYFIESEAPEHLRNPINATKQIPAKNKAVSTLYNQLTNNGYYCLPDGRRRETTSDEEWEAALEGCRFPGDADADDKAHELFFNGARALRSYVRSQTGEFLEGSDQEILQLLHKTYLNGFEGDKFLVRLNSTDHDQRLIEESLGFKTPVEWHLETSLPDDLTAYDLLKAMAENYDRAGIDQKALLEAFKKEFAEVYAAIINHVRECLEHVNLPTKEDQPFRLFYTWGQLAKADLYQARIRPDAEKIVEVWTASDNSTEALIKRERARMAGISVLKRKAEHYELDEHGNFLEFDSVPGYVLQQNIDHTFDFKVRLDQIRDYYELLIAFPLKNILAYNELMDMIGKAYVLPELKEIQIDKKAIARRMELFNETLLDVYANIYGTEADKAKKRAFLKKNFPLLNLDDYMPTKASLKQVYSHIKELGFTPQAWQEFFALDLFILPLTESVKKG